MRYILVFLLYIYPYGAVANDIRVGMSAALSGLSKDLGQQMKLGIELRFLEENLNGGIKGKNIRLIALDDGYKPLKAAANMRTLINEENVLAVVGNTGTPTAVLTAPIANKHGILMFGSYTGADVLRGEHAGCCIDNYRASYKQETAVMVQHILKSGIKAEEIAFFTQNDAYGDAGYSGAISELKVQGYGDVNRLLNAKYRRNTINVEQAVADVLVMYPVPKAIIMIGSYRASSAFIKILKPEKPDLQFYNISFTGSAPLLKNLGDLAEGLYITEVVPSVLLDSPITNSYRAALTKVNNQSYLPSTVSLEGYIVADVFIEALHSINGDISRKAISLAMKGIIDSKNNSEKMDGCLNNIKNQVSHTVWLKKVVRGNFETIHVSHCDK